MQEYEAYLACQERLAATDARAAKALETLQDRGSLGLLKPEDYLQLNPELVHWLLRAESHAGSEIVYCSEDDKVRGIPLGSFFDYPERYASKMPHGAFVSAETENGGSIVLYLAVCSSTNLVEALEQTDQQLPLTTALPLRERIESKLRTEGHLNCLSAEGLKLLSTKLIKYLDYAVNVRPGSEIIYVLDSGEVCSDPLEEALKKPDKYLTIRRPAFLAIEIHDASVLFDTHDISPANLWRLQKKARQVVDARQQAKGV